MKSGAFASFTRSLGLKVINERMSAGMYGKWLILAADRGRSATLSFAAQTGSDKDRKKEVERKLKGTGLTLAGWLSRSVVFQRAGESVSREVLEADAALAARILEECSVEPVRQCPICGKPYPDRAGFFEDSYVPLHRRCLEETYRNPVPSADPDRINQPYANGVMGMLGAVAVITILSIFWGKVLTFTFILIPLVTFYVYGRSGGALTGTGKVGMYTALTSLAGFFLAILLVSSWDLYRGGDYSFLVAVGAMLRIMATGIVPTIIKNLVPLIITAVGVMLVIFGVNSNEKKVRRGSEIAMKTVIDL